MISPLLILAFTKEASGPLPHEDEGDYAERKLHESGDILSYRHATGKQRKLMNTEPKMTAGEKVKRFFTGKTPKSYSDRYGEHYKGAGLSEHWEKWKHHASGAGVDAAAKGVNRAVEGMHSAGKQLRIHHSGQGHIYEPGMGVKAISDYTTKFNELDRAYGEAKNKVWDAVSSMHDASHDMSDARMKGLAGGAAVAGGTLLAGTAIGVGARAGGKALHKRWKRRKEQKKEAGFWSDLTGKGVEHARAALSKAEEHKDKIRDKKQLLEARHYEAHDKMRRMAKVVERGKNKLPEYLSAAKNLPKWDARGVHQTRPHKRLSDAMTEASNKLWTARGDLQDAQARQRSSKSLAVTGAIAAPVVGYAAYRGGKALHKKWKGRQQEKQGSRDFREEVGKNIIRHGDINHLLRASDDATVEPAYTRRLDSLRDKHIAAWAKKRGKTFDQLSDDEHFEGGFHAEAQPDYKKLHRMGDTHKGEYWRSLDKKADDPSAALLPKVKGLKSIRNNGPKLRMGTKGQVPVNPFSGNWVSPQQKMGSVEKLAYLQGYMGALTGRTLQEAQQKAQHAQGKVDKLHAAVGKASKVRGQRFDSAMEHLDRAIAPSTLFSNKGGPSVASHADAAIRGLDHSARVNPLRPISGRVYDRLTGEASRAAGEAAGAASRQRMVRGATAAVAAPIAAYGAYKAYRHFRPKQQPQPAPDQQKTGSTTVGDIAHQGARSAAGAAGKATAAAPGLAKQVWDQEVAPIGHAALGLAGLAGAGLIAHKSLKAWKRPYDEEVPNTRAQSGAIHAARGILTELPSRLG